jgi:hypothetical protein
MKPHPYRLEPLSPVETAGWDDLIQGSAGRELFHRRAWLDYLAAALCADIKQWAIRDGATTLGYLCGGIVRKGPFRILGSPLRSWGTNFMGPLATGEVDQSRLLATIDHLARNESLAMTELESRFLDDRQLDAAQYEAELGWTYLVPLAPGNLEPAWKGLDSTCRNRVRKAEKAGLTVEDIDDPTVADDFYDQYTELMLRKGLVPPYPREYPRLLVSHLKKADLLFALRVRDASGRVLATGLYPHDEQTVYFWGGASWQDGRDLCPNEFLHWSAMRLATERGLTVYNMCGYGRFKKKFGGRLVTLRRWHKLYWRSARWARGAYELYFQKRLRLRGWWRKFPQAHNDVQGEE